MNSIPFLFIIFHKKYVDSSNINYLKDKAFFLLDIGYCHIYITENDFLHNCILFPAQFYLSAVVHYEQHCDLSVQICDYTDFKCQGLR